MKRKWIPMVIFLTITLIPAMALGAEFQGAIQGFNCVTQGVVCPVGKEDPMIAAESIFVLQTKDGKWYFVPNVDQGILARHLNEMVMIDGDLNMKFNAIKAASIHVMENNKWRKVWSVDLQDEIYSDVFGAHPLKRGK
jgi:hypothetical protein